MSRRGVSAPLAVQMENLKKSMDSRGQRRNQERMQREQAGVDIYEKKNQPSNATGGVQLGPESAAFAAVQRAAALAGPSMIHCDLCNANFAGDAQYKQHVEGPIHRKALAKAEAQRQRDLQLGASKGAAESALAAAAWANGGVLSGRRQVSQAGPARPPVQDTAMVPQQSSQGGMYANRGSTGVAGRLGGRQQGAGRGRGRDAAEQAAAEAARQAAILRHGELVASARKEDGPISIGGWVPPSVSAVPLADSGTAYRSGPPSSYNPAASDAQHDDGSEASADHDTTKARATPEHEDCDPVGSEGDEGHQGGLVAYSDGSSESDEDDDKGDEGARSRIVSFF